MFTNDEKLFAGSENQIEEIQSLVRSVKRLRGGEKSFEAGLVILEEGQANDELLILVEGQAKLVKIEEDAHAVEVDAFAAGSILGLTSFWSKQPVFASIVATTDVVCLAITRSVWNKVILQDPTLMTSVQSLFVSNLSNRYRHMIQTHLERDRLSRQLEKERNHLKNTLLKLEHMTNRLVNQERLATMGQLVAGIAHEINNPVGALTRNIATASGALSTIFSEGLDHENEKTVLMEGLCCPFWSTDEKRCRIDAILSSNSNLQRSVARRLAQLTDKAMEVVRTVLGKPERLNRYLSIYELGVCFRGASISSTRIETIVKGLKNYGRQTGDAWTDSDIVQGIQDTLTVLGNRMKNYNIEVNLDACPQLNCNLGEINQVWTNLITNAMDATPLHGNICVSCKPSEEEIEVHIEDSGTGIELEKRDRVFEANYTTKNQSGSFALGLGLSISKEIVEKHGGKIRVDTGALGGARFTVNFPLKSE